LNLTPKKREGGESMGLDRRAFLKHLASMGGFAVASKTTQALAQQHFAGYPDSFGVLVDLTVCIGCRRCEWACNNVNKLPNKPITEFENKSVFETNRRTNAVTFTVVNRFNNPKTPEKPIYVKKQCMHCNEPACASVCPLKAFTKTPEGAVVYNPSICFGCRYCMAACPFNIPAYEYDDPFTPKVTKCTFCFDRIRNQGGVPGCVEICPVEALIFGKRSELVDLAHEKIMNNPDRYVNHVYGEHEVGGTSWMYISPRPFEELGFRTDLGTTPIPQYGRGFLSLVPIIAVTCPVICMGLYSFSKRRTALENAESKSN